MNPDPAVLPAHRDTVAALLARRSVRRYAPVPVAPATLAAIRAAVPGVRPLSADGAFACAVESIPGSSRRLAAALGSYAAIISARQYLAARLSRPAGASGWHPEFHPLIEFGFRVEQLVIRLTRLGLGSCWVGTLQHEDRARALVGAGPAERVPAVVMFGQPARAAGARLVNRALRAVVGAPRRLAFDRFAFQDRYGTPLEPEPDVRFLLDCLRHAPSAGNARPWRVILRDRELLLCVDESAGYYRLMKLARWGYPWLDAGIGLAHLTIALTALGRPADWQGVADTPDLRAALDLPASVKPVARLNLTAGSDTRARGN